MTSPRPRRSDSHTSSNHASRRCPAPRWERWSRDRRHEHEPDDHGSRHLPAAGWSQRHGPCRQTRDGPVRPHGRAGRGTAVDRLRRGRSALGVPRPVSPSRALAALASHATAASGRPGRRASPAGVHTPYGGGVKRPAAQGAGPTGHHSRGGHHAHPHPEPDHGVRRPAGRSRRAGLPGLLRAGARWTADQRPWTGGRGGVLPPRRLRLCRDAHGRVGEPTEMTR
jgi:hypothetical protein